MTAFSSIADVNRPKPTDPKERRKKLIAILVLLVIAIFGAGIGIGTAIGHTTVKTVSKPVTHTVTKTVDVPTVPQACLNALDEADQGFSKAAEATSAFQSIIVGIQNQDVSAINDGTDQIKTVNSDLDDISVGYTADKAECRSAGN